MPAVGWGKITKSYRTLKTEICMSSHSKDSSYRRNHSCQFFLRGGKQSAEQCSRLEPEWPVELQMSHGYGGRRGKERL